MAEIPNLRILDLPIVSRECDFVSEVFHQINRVLPEDHKVLTLPPKTLVREAIELMLKYDYSQVPVKQGNLVLGVFSFRSLSKGTAKTTLDALNKDKFGPGDLTVDEFLEEFKFARVTEEMDQFLEAIDKDNGILVGTPENLIGILTPVDFVKYLNKIASPFVMISECELALRALIRISLEPEEIVAAAKRSLLHAYDNDEDKIPSSLEEMTFENYRSLISHRQNWDRLQSVFGSTRNRVSTKLQEVGSIRNELFHFKKESISVEDHETLADNRNWLLNRLKQVDAKSPKEMKQ